MNKGFASRSAVVALMVLLGFTFAQNPLSGAYLETQIGFVVEFTESPAGLTGNLHGATGAMPLDIVADTQNVQGTFLLDGTVMGFSAQLQPDGNTLWIWLYGLDAQGNAVDGTYEQYEANRLSPEDAAALLGGTPAAPEVTGPPPVQLPDTVEPTAPELPPVIGGVDTVRPGDVATSEPGAGGTPPPLGSPPTVVPGGIADQRIIGQWQGTIQVQGMDFIVTSVFTADGQYREDIWQDGQSAGWYSGTFSLDPSGLLTYHDVENSPQLCIGTQCVDNSVDGVPSYSQITFVDDNTLLTATVEEGGVAGMQVQMMRIGGQ